MHCPLGFAIRERDCPSAPCLSCMRNFGDAIMRDLKQFSPPNQHGLCSVDKVISKGVNDKLKEHGFEVPTRDSYAEYYFRECAVEHC